VKAKGGRLLFFHHSISSMIMRSRGSTTSVPEPAWSAKQGTDGNRDQQSLFICPCLFSFVYVSSFVVKELLSSGRKAATYSGTKGWVGS
jgi:hypothetical protein